MTITAKFKVVRGKYGKRPHDASRWELLRSWAAQGVWEIAKFVGFFWLAKKFGLTVSP